MKRRGWMVAGIIVVLVGLWFVKRNRESHKPSIDSTTPELPDVVSDSGVPKTAIGEKNNTQRSSQSQPAGSDPKDQDPNNNSEAKISPDREAPQKDAVGDAKKPNISAAVTPNQNPVASKPLESPPVIDDRPKASVPELSCEEQWRHHVALFKTGADLAYMTSLSVQRPLASDITTSHIETITQSSSSGVTRDIAFSSDHPSGILVLSSLSAASSVTTSKQAFLSLCQAAGGRAVSSVLFKFVRGKLLDVADDNVKVGAGAFPVYRMKFAAELMINAKATAVMADIWVAKNKIGLVVKETIKLSPKTFSDHGSITITSQLAGTRKI